MIVVKAKQNNLAKVSGIFNALNTVHYNFSDTKKIKTMIDRGWVYTIKVNKNIMAAMVLKPAEGSYQIYAIASTRKGGGRALIDFAVKKCQKEKVPKLWCWSLSRYKAKGFYQKMGFKEQLKLKKQWYGEDCYIFGRVIKWFTRAVLN